MGDDKVHERYTKMSGTLFLVGVGPGDPDLLTLKAVRVIAAANCVAYPDGKGAPGMAHDIACAHISASAERLPVAIPMIPDPEKANRAYDLAAEGFAERLERGDDIAYLCEGDPLFYGSAIYLLERLGPRYETVIVPGITSLTAAAAAAARPIVSRNQVLRVLPATLSDERLRAELATMGTASFAIFKIGRHFNRVCALLEEAGHAKGAFVVEHATHARQTITPLGDFKHRRRPYFSILLCGSPVAPPGDASDKENAAP
jgi:precorrin-2/cobalt-factor-2 C20-methyltransferase